MKLETAINDLEAAIEALEQDDISLEEALSEYQKGMKMLKTCNEAIEKIEKKVLMINEEGETVEFK